MLFRPYSNFVIIINMIRIAIPTLQYQPSLHVQDESLGASDIPLVGREDELSRLTECVADLREEKKGSVVFIVGAAVVL